MYKIRVQFAVFLVLMCVITFNFAKPRYLPLFLGSDNNRSLTGLKRVKKDIKYAILWQIFEKKVFSFCDIDL